MSTIDSPQSTASLTLHANTVIDIATKTLQRIKETREKELEIFIDNFINRHKPGRIGKLFGRKLPSRTREEWKQRFLNDLSSLNYYCAYKTQERICNELIQLAQFSKLNGDGMIVLTSKDLNMIS